MKIVTDEEKRLNEELDEAIHAFSEAIRQMSPEKRAYCIIKQFMQHENKSDELMEQFYNWLISPHHGKAKEMALQRCFEECLNEQAHLGRTETIRVAAS